MSTGHAKHDSMEGINEPKKTHSKHKSMDTKHEENISWEEMLREGPELLKKEENKKKKSPGKFLTKSSSSNTRLVKKEPPAPAPASSLLPRDRTNLPEKNVPSSLLIKDALMEGKSIIRIKGKSKVCFLVLDNYNLYIFKSATDTGDPQKIPLLLCTVKLLPHKGPKCWQLITPNFTLKFESSTDKELLEWTAGIQEICDSVTRESITKTGNDLDTSEKKDLFELLKLPANQVCADCNSPKPEWASVNYGVFICIQCSGIHRKLGTHITKVQSVTLDTWEPEQIEHVKQIGNGKANVILEYAIPNNHKKPNPNDPISVKEEWIRNKYELQLYRAVSNEVVITTSSTELQTTESTEQLDDYAASWKEALAPTGRKYYWNVHTRETSWVHPTLRRNAKQKMQDSISSYVEVEKAKLKEEEAKILQEEELLEKEMSELKEKVRSLSIST